MPNTSRLGSSPRHAKKIYTKVKPFKHPEEFSEISHVVVSGVSKLVGSEKEMGGNSSEITAQKILPIVTSL
jgi:hypothetical protein